MFYVCFLWFRMTHSLKFHWTIRIHSPLTHCHPPPRSRLLRIRLHSLTLILTLRLSLRLLPCTGTIMVTAQWRTTLQMSPLAVRVQQPCPWLPQVLHSQSPWSGYLNLRRITVPAHCLWSAEPTFKNEWRTFSCMDLRALRRFTRNFTTRYSRFPLRELLSSIPYCFSFSVCLSVCLFICLSIC